ncbi:MAG: hypothetical protein IPK10_18635 [Bacteroidetes bacterium]|nr:hypothetical protein [Bacteroidota bacterium]
MKPYKSYLRSIKQLVVIGVPANNFGGQEPDPMQKSNYFVRRIQRNFPLTSKYPLKVVILVLFSNG